MAREIIESLGAGTGQGYLDAFDLQASRERIERWIADSSLHIIKSHDVPDFLLNREAGGGVIILYVHRDLRQVARSAMQKFPSSAEQLLENIDQALLVYDAVRSRKDTLVQTFDSLLHNRQKALSDIASFLKLSPSQDLIAQIARSTSTETSLDNQKKSNASILLAFKRQLYRINRHLRIMVLVKAILPPSWAAYIRRSLYPNDPKTLMHSDHIASRKSPLGVDAARLETIITHRYAGWLEENGYT
jgi:hypothetical protein